MKKCQSNMFRTLRKLVFILALFLAGIGSVNAAIEGLEWTVDTQGLGDGCIPTYRSTVWTSCSEGSQSRTVIDLNSCGRDRTETRVCEEGNDEIQNMFLNAREVSLEVSSAEDGIYRGNVSGGTYNYMFYTNGPLLHDAFLVINPDEDVLYVGRLVEILEDQHFYLIKDVEDDDSTILLESGFLKNTALEQAERETFMQRYVFSVFGFVVVFMIALTLVFIVIFAIKKHHRGKSSSFSSANSVSGSKTVTASPTSSNPFKPVEKNYSAEYVEHVDKKKPTIDSKKDDSSAKAKSAPATTSQDDKQKKKSFFGSLFKKKDKDSKTDSKDGAQKDKKEEPKVEKSAAPVEKKQVASVSSGSSAPDNRDVEVVRNYINRNSYLSDDDLRKNLQGVGWNDEVIEAAFKKAGR